MDTMLDRIGRCYVLDVYGGQGGAWGAVQRQEGWTGGLFSKLSERIESAYIQQLEEDIRRKGQVSRQQANRG